MEEAYTEMARSANRDPATGVFRGLGDTPNFHGSNLLPRALWEETTRTGTRPIPLARPTPPPLGAPR